MCVPPKRLVLSRITRSYQACSSETSCSFPNYTELQCVFLRNILFFPELHGVTMCVPPKRLVLSRITRSYKACSSETSCSFRNYTELQGVFLRNVWFFPELHGVTRRVPLKRLVLSRITWSYKREGHTVYSDRRENLEPSTTDPICVSSCHMGE
jgi:hypothetical protein